MEIFERMGYLDTTSFSLQLFEHTTSITVTLQIRVIIRILEDDSPIIHEECFSERKKTKLVGRVPADGRGVGLDGFSGPFQPKTFCDYD